MHTGCALDENGTASCRAIILLPNHLPETNFNSLLGRYHGCGIDTEGAYDAGVIMAMVKSMLTEMVMVPTFLPIAMMMMQTLDWVIQRTVPPEIAETS